MNTIIVVCLLMAGASVGFSWGMRFYIIRECVPKVPKELRRKISWWENLRIEWRSFLETTILCSLVYFVVFVAWLTCLVFRINQEKLA